MLHSITGKVSTILHASFILHYSNILKHFYLLMYLVDKEKLYNARVGNKHNRNRAAVAARLNMGKICYFK